MSSIFDLHILVQPQHIDALGHVNNVMYVQWMQDVAAAHVETLGVGVTKYLELKHAMVAVEHHVQYRKAAFEGEEIVLRTWLDDINALYSFRQYVFFRPSEQAVLFVGNTKWACCKPKIEMSGFSKVKMSAFRICTFAISLADGLICWCLCRIKNL
ncbi:acyl-CoA thioesterase, partial [Acinetobacter nosocomialis]|uniref:acyl-CoA thioesterase n=3 Tax=Acinetobacter nosocomialis TaxID=106654 RepID=UPI0024DE2DBE